MRDELLRKWYEIKKRQISKIKKSLGETKKKGRPAFRRPTGQKRNRDLLKCKGEEVKKKQGGREQQSIS